MGQGRKKSWEGKRNPKYNHGACIGGLRSPEYNAWVHMHRRCKDVRYKYYSRYGGRGISVHPAWEDFAVFLAYVGVKPSSKHSLDRINNDGNYEPGNVRWATQQEQVRNSSRVSRVNLGNDTKLLVEWAELYGVSAQLVYDRLKRGWTPEDAVSSPLTPPRAPRKTGYMWGALAVGACIEAPYTGRTGKGEDRTRCNLRMSLYTYNRRHGTDVQVEFSAPSEGVVRCTRVR